jgi:hypothetical protein
LSPYMVAVNAENREFPGISQRQCMLHAVMIYIPSP